MNKSSKIYVAGHSGLVGSAICRRLKDHGYKNLVVRGHSKLDLESQVDTREFFESEKPDVVILAAAKVGGILANSSYPADFIKKNLAIQNNVIHEAHRVEVEELLFLGSSCIYPRDCPNPIRESHLLSGPLEPTNRPYAIAKISGIEMCWAYNRQYGRRYLAVMPTNLYGIGDNYDLETSHVLPALLRKVHEAKLNKEASFEAWGTGKALREFLYSDDLADATIVLLTTPLAIENILQNDDRPPLVNIGSSSEVSIRELADLIVDIIEYDGVVCWNKSKPDGTPRKILDSSLINSLGWLPSTNLQTGISSVYKEFCERYSRLY